LLFIYPVSTSAFPFEELFHVNIMQSVLGGTIQKAGEAVSHAMPSNKKIADMKSDIREPTSSDRIASDFGVRSGNTDIWLSASTENYKGPQLLEDNFAREKVGIYHINEIALF
jgi:catalase